MTFTGKCYRDIVRALAEAYAERWPNTLDEAISDKRAKLIAQGLETCLRGQVRGVRRQRLVVLAELFGRPFRSTKELLTPEGVALLRWLYNLGEDTPFTAGLTPPPEKRRAVLGMLDIAVPLTPAEQETQRLDELALYGEPL